MAIEIQTTTSRILVRNTPFHHKDLLKGLPGAAWDKERRAWTYPLSSSVLPMLMSLYPFAGLDAGAQSLLGGLERMKKALSSKASSKHSLPVVSSTLLPPWEHQLQSYHFARHLLNLDGVPIGGGALLGLDMGTGKTKVVYDLINNYPNLKTILVTCPKSVVQTWADEKQKHGIRDIRVMLLGTGPVPSRTKKAKAFLRTHSESACVRMIVINHESVWREPFKSFIKERIWDLLVVDECHRAKAPGGKFSRFLSNNQGCFSTRTGLTGTPMPKDPMDIYAQARFLDPGIFGTSFTRFKLRYGIWGKFENRKFLGLRNAEEFQTKLDQLMIRVKSDDVMDLPPQIFERRTCSLSGPEMKAYSQMKEELIADVGSGVVTAANGLVRLLKLQQITQGTIKDDQGKEHRIGSSKQDLLADVLEDFDSREPVVIFCRFKDDLLRIHETCESLGRDCLELSGSVDELAQWKNAHAPILAVQIQAGGVGVDFSRSCYNIFYSPTFDMGAYEQALKRTHRPGQLRTTFYYQLVAEGTIDVDIYNALRTKKKVVEAALSGLTRRSTNENTDV